MNKHLHLVYRAQNTARLDVELFTETALVHGIAGFTAKSGARQQLKLWRTQKDQRERISSHWPAAWLLGKGSRPISARSDCAHWAFPAKRLWTSERVQPLPKSSSASFWRNACAVGREKLAGAASCSARSIIIHGTMESRDYFACHACRSGRECITHNSSVCVHWNETKTCTQLGCQEI